MITDRMSVVWIHPAVVLISFLKAAVPLPAFPVLFYFGGVYLLGANFNGPSVCNAALFSAILYAVTAFLYHYVCETERYLALQSSG